MKKIFAFFLTLLFICFVKGQRSSNYCTQVWMDNNLTVDTYRNGDKIPNVTDPAVWSALTTGAWCWYDNDSAANSKYGKLYNWYAVKDTRGLAPQGWHIPSESELDTALACKDAKQNIGVVARNNHFRVNGSYRDEKGAFPIEYRILYWWSVTENDTGLTIVYGKDLLNDIRKFTADKLHAFPILCIKDK